MTEDRAAYRHGRTAGEVTLDGQRVQVSRPRVRSVAEGQEIALATYRQFTARDPLCEVMLERMLAGVSARKARRVDEPVGKDVRAHGRSTSKSSVSRAFVAGTRTALTELLSRDLSDIELAVLFIDGIDLADMTNVVALSDHD